MNKRSRKIPAAIVLLLTVFLLPLKIFSAGMFRVDQFVAPDTCYGCHSEIYDQWVNSTHNLAHIDPAYVKIASFLRQGLENKDEIKEAEACVKCHTPVGFVSGYPEKFSDDRELIPDIATHGIHCDYCHSAVDTDKMYNNGLVLSPGNGEDDPGIKRGPFDDAEPDYHEAAYSQLHTESRICGTCHNVKHVVFGTDLETTYEEWKNSPYNTENPKERITCQGCHMYQRPGIPATGSTDRPLNPGPASDYTHDRPHIFTHYFIGGNQLIPSMAGDTLKADMAVQRLTHAATLAVDTDLAADHKLEIHVTNSGAGHSIPTGVTDLRQVWLEIVITGEGGKTVFESGRLDEKGYVPQDAIMYKTVYGDENNQPTYNIAKARSILSDYRIPAKQTLTQNIAIPHTVKPGMKLKVRLLYRSLGHRLIDQIPGAGSLKPAVVEMASVETIL